MIGSILQHRYRIDLELGQGGMGVVYRAHDLRLERPVAVKVLSDSGLGTAGRARLLAEAQAAARLNHPNIVQVYDAGETEAGLPFIVMELLEGRNLWETGSLPLPEALAVARQVCAALEHAHAAGIIHRDLKPENILLTRSGTAKLMDFGLARSSEGPRLTEQGVVVGTFAYLAPEILMGQPATASSDLYALGVILYEMAAGRPPFTADYFVSLISQHLYAPPVPPSTYNADVPPALEHIILRLLSKRPEERPDSAGEVRAALESLTLAETGPAAAPHLLDRLARGRLVARDREFAEASALWQRAAAGESGVLLVSGEPGIGKTRLVQELMTLVEISRGVVLLGECYAEGGAPYAPIAQILQGIDLKGLQDLSGLTLADLIALAPGLRARYPEVPPNPPLEPQAEQQRLFESFAALCGTLASRAPLLLVIDDSHWADSGTLYLARHLARRARLARLPLLLVLNYREIELDEARALNEVLLDLNRERLAVRIKLGRLGREETHALVAALLGDDLGIEFLDSIYRETEGNPFFVEEVVKTLIEENELYREDGCWCCRPETFSLHIPQSVRLAIQARVSRLAEPAQEVLRLAAVLGREFDFPTLQAASERGEEVLIDALETAARAQLIGEVRPPNRGTGERGGESFAFAHALIPATLRESVSGLRRHRLHRQAAAAIERLRPDDYEALAYHYSEAGDAARARACYIQAADRARRVYANEDALRFYTEALTLLDPADPTRLDLLAARAAVYDVVARRAEQRADVQAMLELAERLGDDARRCDALVALADVALATDIFGAHEPAGQAVALARALGDPVREAHARRRLGWARHFMEENLAARAELEAAAAGFRAAGLEAEAAASLNMLALALVENKADLPLAQQAAQEAVELSRRAGDRRQEAISLRRLAVVHGARRIHAEELALTEQALAINRAIGDLSEERNALNNLGVIHAHLGNFEASERHLRRALELSERIGTKVGLNMSVISLARLHYARRGEHEAALKLVEEYAGRARAAQDLALSALLEGNAVNLYLSLGLYAEGLAATERVLEQVVSVFSSNIQSSFLSGLGLLLALNRRHAEARARLDEAGQRLQASARPAFRIILIVYQALADLLEAEQTGQPDLLRVAWEKLEPALPLLRETIDGDDLVDVLFIAARLNFRRGRLEAAREFSSEVMQLRESLPYTNMPQEYDLLHYQILCALDRAEEARPYLRRALEWVQRVAGNLHNPGWRRHWLEVHPPNVVIQAAALQAGLTI